MEHVVIGLDDEPSAQTAVEWIIERARSKPVQLRIIAALDVSASNPHTVRNLVAAASQRVQDAAPGTRVETVVTERPMLQVLLEHGDSADLLVIGSHPDPGIRDGRTPSLPISLAARSRCAVVIVPDDWKARGGPVVVGLDATAASINAVIVAAREAGYAARDLEIVHTWEPRGTASTHTMRRTHEDILNAAVERIHADFPGLPVHTVLSEAVAHAGIIANSQDARLIVLGTHGLGRETGLVLGAIHQEVMIRGGVAMCIVPLVEAPVTVG